MALPTTVDPTRPANTESPAEADDQIRALKQAIVDILGWPTDPTSITAAALGMTAGGVLTVQQVAFAIQAGTVGAPSLVITGDTDTGIFSDAANIFAIACSGVKAAQFGNFPLISVSPQNARTNSIDQTALTLRSTTSGTPATGIGTAIQFEAESADETPSILGHAGFQFNDVTAGSEDSEFVIFVRAAGAAASAGYGFNKTGANKVVFAHAATADRTVTLPDSDITAVGTAATQTLTNKTIDRSNNTFVGIPVPTVKSANQNLTPSSTTLQNVTDLQFTPAANTVYFFTLNLLLTGPNTTADWKLGFSVPSGCTMLWGPDTFANASGLIDPTTAQWAVKTTNEPTIAALTEASTLSFASDTGVHLVKFSGIIRNGGTSSALDVQMAQNTSDPGTNTVLKDSVIFITQLQ